MTEFRFRRIYDPPEDADGFRVLGDRLWPRGMRKETAALDLWAKDAAPSHELRKRFHADGDETAFEADYRAELDRGTAVADLLDQLRGQPVITLLTTGKEPTVGKLAVLRDALVAAAKDATEG